FTGVRALRGVPLGDLVPFIDWTFFFTAWELKGRFPAILDHPEYGAAARDLHASGRRLLDRIVAEKLLTANAVSAFRPAAADGDDIVLPDARFSLLRQQESMPSGHANLSLADFIAPEGATAARDHLGAFAVTAGIGADDLVRRYEREHDDF